MSNSASCPRSEKRAQIRADYGIYTFADNADAIEGADVVVLTVKPQVIRLVCEALRPHLLPQQLVVSTAAGINCASLAGWLGARPVVRCMPNTPALNARASAGCSLMQRLKHCLASTRISAWVRW